MGRKPILSNEEVQEAYKLYQGGCSYEVLSVRYKVNWYTIRDTFARNGLKGRTSKETKALGAMTKEDIAKAHELHMTGMTIKAIGRELGIGSERIRWGLKAAGYSTSKVRRDKINGIYDSREEAVL